MKRVLLILGLFILVGAIVIFFMRSEVDAPSSNGTDANHDEMSTSAENQNNSAGNTEDAVEASSVDIKNFAYTPQVITVKKGTTVKWTNQDSDRHTITPDEESGAFKGSELLSRGESYEFTFDIAGTYTYHCTPHPYMKGTVIVTE